MIKISILGCGWLGLPLGKLLVKNNYKIKGSTTSPNKLSVLENAGISPYLIALNENEIEGSFQDFLLDSEILIIDIPPKLRGDSKENFVAKIQNCIPFIENAAVKKLLFVSSTSVYADDNTVVTENTICKPETESGKQLVEVENLLKSNKNFSTTILRCGGLIGADRHPIKFLAGRSNVENPDSPVNLICQDDCLAIISKIISQNVWGETFNAVAPFYPTRNKYYTQKAVEQNLTPPQFKFDVPSKGKTISSEKLINRLDFVFSEI